MLSAEEDVASKLSFLDNILMYMRTHWEVNLKHVQAERVEACLQVFYKQLNILVAAKNTNELIRTGLEDSFALLGNTKSKSKLMARKLLNHYQERPTDAQMMKIDSNYLKLTNNMRMKLTNGTDYKWNSDLVGMCSFALREMIEAFNDAKRTLLVSEQMSDRDILLYYFRQELLLEDGGDGKCNEITDMTDDELKKEAVKRIHARVITEKWKQTELKARLEGLKKWQDKVLEDRIKALKR
jgi:hypothetical protein